MNVPGGQWDNALWDYSLWDFPQNSLLVQGTMISRALIEMFTQTKGNGQVIGAAVLVAGQNLTSLIERVEIRMNGGKATKIASITFIGCDIPGLAIDAAISVSFSFRLATDEVFSETVFAGSISTILPNRGAKQQTTRITAKDAPTLALEQPYNGILDGGNLASTWLAEKIAAAGLGTADLMIRDYVGGGSTLSFDALGEALLEVAGGIGNVVGFLGNLGTFTIHDVENAMASSWSIPLTGITSWSESENGNRQYDVVLVNGFSMPDVPAYTYTVGRWDSNLNRYVYETVTAPAVAAPPARAAAYNSLLGISAMSPEGEAGFDLEELKALLQCDSIDYTLNSNVLWQADDLLEKAKSLSAFSKRKWASFEVPLNPYLTPGLKVSAVLPADNLAHDLVILNVTHGFSWPAGGWTNLTGVFA